MELQVTERIASDCVYMVHGLGQRAPGLRRANGKGGSDSEILRNYAVDPIGGTTGMRTELVRVRKNGV
ncbi:MAG: hypothetical protein WCI05_10860 [Myxococcales bacterium]